MNCYYHHDASAVGICKSCHRGLCSSCAAEIPNAIACRERCEQAAKKLTKVLRDSEGAMALMGAFLIVLGVAFGGTGLWFRVQYGEGPPPFPIFMGVIFVIFGILLTRNSLKARAESKQGGSAL